MHMKTFLALFVFLFSSSVFAKDLPNSLFGIELFKINNFVLGEEIKKYSKKSKIGNNYYLGHSFINNKIPKDNANVSNYAIYTDNNNAIVHIIGYKNLGKPDYKSSLNDYVCSEQKESLVESLKSYYSIIISSGVVSVSILGFHVIPLLPDPNFAPLFVNGSLYNSDSKYFCILGSCLKLLKKSEIRGYLSKAKTLFLSAFSTKL